MDDILNAGKTWLEHGNGVTDKTTGQPMDEFYFLGQFIDLARILVYIGIITVLIVTAVMAIKWITATPDKQAKLKQQLIGLVISIIVIFGAVGIWSVIKGILGQVETDLTANNNNNSKVIMANIENNEV